MTSNSATTGRTAWPKRWPHPIEAVILDVMMPGMDGFAVLRELRKKSDVPVLMLTALGDEADRIVGLEIGADDYLPKTFSSRELLARVRAVIRRTRIRVVPGMPAELVAGPLRVCEETHTAVLDDQALDLTTLEFAILDLAAQVQRPRQKPRAPDRGGFRTALRRV